MRFFRIAAILTLLISGSQGLFGALALHAPTLSVHELHYGIEIHGTQRQSIEKIMIHLYNRGEPDANYHIQCFFLKKGKPGEPPTIHDTVLFEVTNPRASYEVTAKPIKLSGGNKPTKAKTSKKKGAKKTSAKSTKVTKPSSADFPREGYIVRVLCNGVVVRTQASSHPLERLSKEDPDFLNQAAYAKSARYFEPTDLLKK